MKSSSIFKKDLKKYDVSRLNSLTTSEDAKQIENRSNIQIELAIYDMGTKVVKKQNEDSYTISTINIYCDLGLLKTLDLIPFNRLDYLVLEQQNFSDYSFYKAVANV